MIQECFSTFVYLILSIYSVITVISVHNYIQYLQHLFVLYSRTFSLINLLFYILIQNIDPGYLSISEHKQPIFGSRILHPNKKQHPNFGSQNHQQQQQGFQKQEEISQVQLENIKSDNSEIQISQNYQQNMDNFNQLFQDDLNSYQHTNKMKFIESHSNELFQNYNFTEFNIDRLESKPVDMKEDFFGGNQDQNCASENVEESEHVEKQKVHSQIKKYKDSGNNKQQEQEQEQEQDNTKDDNNVQDSKEIKVELDEIKTVNSEELQSISSNSSGEKKQKTHKIVKSQPIQQVKFMKLPRQLSHQDSVDSQKKKNVTKSLIQRIGHLQSKIWYMNEKNVISDKEKNELVNFCIKCQMDQPLRAKHCQFCQKCVATYDHHCFWIGSCVGERNKLLFIVFLLQEILRIVLFGYILLTTDKPANEIANLLKDFGILLAIVLGSLLVVLFIYQFYLATINLTSWENIRWNSISYLQDHDHRNGHPFSLGFLGNLKLLIQGCLNKQPIKWQFNKRWLQQNKVQ